MNPSATTPDEVPNPCSQPSTLNPLSAKASATADQLASAARPPDWPRRLESLRAAEWELVSELIPLTTRLLHARAYQHRREPSLADLPRMLNLISRLHQLLAKLNDDDMQRPQPLPIPRSILDAIERIYGPKLSKPQPPASLPSQPAPPAPSAPVPLTDSLTH